jgi:hypothetical protein
MAILSERAQRAKRVADDLGAMPGVWVISAPDDSGRLVFQVLDCERNIVTQTIRDWGFEPTFRTLQPRVGPVGIITGASLYEINLGSERQPIIDDRTIRGEIAEPTKKTDVEMAGMRRYLSGYLGPKK